MSVTGNGFAQQIPSNAHIRPSSPGRIRVELPCLRRSPRAERAAQVVAQPVGELCSVPQPDPPAFTSVDPSAILDWVGKGDPKALRYETSYSSRLKRSIAWFHSLDAGFFLCGLRMTKHCASATLRPPTIAGSRASTSSLGAASSGGCLASWSRTASHGDLLRKLLELPHALL